MWHNILPMLISPAYRSALLSSTPLLWLLTSGCAQSEADDADGGQPGAASKADELEDSSAGDGATSGGGETIACPDPADVFPAVWPDGSQCDQEDDLTVHRYDDDTFIIRQSLCTSFEAPFIYLLFGEHTVLVEDSGAGGVAIADKVVEVVEQWKADRGDPTAEIEILLINSHAHGDHVAGNQQFAGLPQVTIIGFQQEQIAEFLDIGWPDESGEIELGGRIVDVVPIPGHEANHVALYDRDTKLLLTGDTLYPGRLFIDEFGDYVQSYRKLADFKLSHPICFALGAHIELSTTPGDDFDFGATEHPDEHELQMHPDQIDEVLDALEAMNGVPRRESHDHFIIFPL